MNTNQLPRLLALMALALFTTLAAGMSMLGGGNFDLSWNTIDGGGGTSTGGNFALSGTIGQHDAGPVMTGGSFALSGGFWPGTAGGPSSQIAPLIDVAMGLRGTSISGGVAQLLTSDNTFHITRSQFGFLATEPNVLNVIYGFDSPNLAATQIGMTVEHRLNQPGGSVRWQFKHWNTNSFGAAVNTYPIGSTEITRNLEGISATNRIRQTDGRMEMQVTVFTLSVFSPLGFDQFTDFVQATVQ